MKSITWLRSTALWLSLGYGLYLATGLPLIWFEWWNFPAHLGLFGVSLLPFVIFHLKQRTRSLDSKTALSVPGTVLLIASIGVGVFLQRHSIYHYYATHDPSAYLNSAQHLARTGTVLHRSPLVKAAYGEGKSQLIPVLGLRESSEPWHQIKNYGVLPKDRTQGTSTFHGLFGAPLFLASAIKVVGENSFLRVQWLHLIACTLLLAALLAHFLPKRPVLVAASTLLFTASPLVTYVFREPLSEPLAAVFFLGILFGLLEHKNSRKLGTWIVSLCLMGALTTRVSGLFYVPFLLLASVFLPAAARKERITLALALLASTALALAFVFRFASTYATDTLAFYTNLAEKIAVPRIAPILAIAGVLLAVGLVVSRGRIVAFCSKILAPKNWQKLWYLGFVLLAIAVIIRYFRLVTVLSHNIGGYPFVLFNLDSLIFYGSPAVVLFGLGIWIWKLSERPQPELLFLQGFLPFVLFFYGAFRFMPLNTQPNFQRYLVIELLPLAIIGFALGADLLLRSATKKVWVTALFTLSLTWNGLLLASINHSNISEGGRQFYSQVNKKLEQLEKNGEKPVIAVVAADWIEMAFLQPLANGFGKNVVFLRSAFSAESSQAIDALIKDGYSPLLTVPSRLLFSRRAPLETSRRWNESDQWKGCYEYPKFGFGAPPRELEKNCADFTVYRPETHVSRGKRTVRPSWLYRTREKPERIWDWYGLEVYGPSICLRSDLPKVEVGVLFSPETTFVAPQLTVNGHAAGTTQVIPSGSGKTKHATEVWLSMDAKDFDCTQWNTVDVMIPPAADNSRRVATLIDARFEGRSLYEDEDALQLFP